MPGMISSSMGNAIFTVAVCASSFAPSSLRLRRSEVKTNNVSLMLVPVSRDCVKATTSDVSSVTPSLPAISIRASESEAPNAKSLRTRCSSSETAPGM